MPVSTCSNSNVQCVDLIARYIPLIESIRVVASNFVTLLAHPCLLLHGKIWRPGWMILLVSFLGLTNGYLTVCVLTAAPKGYKGRAKCTGQHDGVFSSGGIFAGVALDWLWLIGNGTF
ncbi:unnamed protein product [Thlaspi arvense]|uniref:Uncharacterized protein n=1 Tax=Thlaspi arvense TaxID=13288 RepID=A0AAU9RHY1_THLAR|nr:unnamed protein product [Thlaspi arvense]